VEKLLAAGASFSIASDDESSCDDIADIDGHDAVDAVIDESQPQPKRRKLQ
jgi:hypothetical protein